MATSAAFEKLLDSASSNEAADLAWIKAILMRALDGKSCAVYLFGSRAAGAAHPAANFDVAVFANEDISRELSLAREMLEESTVPFKVDLADLRSVSAAFRQQIQAQGKLLWKNGEFGARSEDSGF